MATYIKDLIELPDQVRRGDFVLRLTEGVTRPDETVATYVVTPQLVRSFDDALGLIRSAVEGRTSKAAYLHGSFGSGKSHFMAILYLLLHHNAAVRSVSELAPVIEKHNAWIQGKKFLLITYYMIGAKDMESKILGEYVRQIEHLHPGTPIPGVYRSEALFKDAEGLRAGMGDEQFFAKLNKGAAGKGASGWGEIAAGWGPESFEAAITASPKSEERVRLVGDLVENFYTYAKSGDSEFVDLDTGLSVISKHAKSLGYDGLILFLDELILWLASQAADVEFVTREGQKLIKLVESQTSDRPTPIISFVARQRDLRELVGDNLTGAGIVSFSDTLKHWEARFATIKLEDRNLPAIAEKRILKPKSEAARQQLDEAFRQTQQIQKEVLDVLLTSHSDPAAFRKVYPFSPALIDTLVDVSSLLQRERTALKIMLQLLVEQKDRLKLGDIVPVGDLFDAVAEGDEAFSDTIESPRINACASQGESMRRRRFQKGSLQLRKHADRRVWVVLYYDEKSERRYHTLGWASEMNKGTADEKRQEFMREINGGGRTTGATRPPTVTEFLEQVYLPFYLGKWKESTAGTSENRLRHHIVKELGPQRLEDLTLAPLQQFLERKAASGLSFSVVDHLRWDISSMFEMAVSEKVISVNPTAALYTPKTAKRSESQTMSAQQVELALGAVECREKVILRLAVFAGMRPGELLAVQRKHVKPDASVIEIRRRVYRGKFAAPKNGLVRTIAIPPSTAALLRDWMEKAVDQNPETYVFAGETGQPLWRSSLLEDHIRAKLEPIGLGWVNFQVMRRTHASLGHHAKVDPKVSADQRGHGIGVALDVYTKSSMEDRATAAKQLEDSVLTRAVRARKRSRDS